jgi:hypothetical protein
MAMVALTLAATGCAVRPTPDPRSPAPVRDAPVTMRVCYVNGDGAHLAVGDQVEFSNGRLGGLKIRHIPGPDNNGGAWNGGEPTKVRSAVLVEIVDPKGEQRNRRRFVPVGRFGVRLGEGEHARFDFHASKATANLDVKDFPECDVDLGADEVLIRGVVDDDRHGGDAIVR